MLTWSLYVQRPSKPKTGNPETEKLTTALKGPLGAGGFEPPTKGIMSLKTDFFAVLQIFADLCVLR